MQGIAAREPAMSADAWGAVAREAGRGRPEPALSPLVAQDWTFAPGVHSGVVERSHVVWVHTQPAEFRLERPFNGTGRGSYRFQPGAIVLQKAGEAAAISSERACSLTTVSVDVGRFTAFCDHAGVRIDDVMRRFGEPDETLVHIALALSSTGGESRSGLLTEAIDAAFLARLLDRHTSWPAKLPGAISKRDFAHVQDYVQGNLDGEISIRAMADVAGLSVYHFSRVFARSTGETPHRFVMKARVRFAERLLGDASLTIAEVAYEAGFADQSHLTRWMRREIGATPSRVRAAALGG